MTTRELDTLIAFGMAGNLSKQEQKQLATELQIYRDMAHRLERCVHDLIKEAEAVQKPDLVHGWRKMDKMTDPLPTPMKYDGPPIDVAPCPDCGASPYIAEAMFYSGTGAVAVCASCKKPYRPRIKEAEK